MLPVGLCAQLACIWEATARKPGNVHRYRDFGDTTYVDFLLSAAAIAPVMETAEANGVGATVLAAVRATRQVVQANTNLGIILLLAPLAAVPRRENLQAGVMRLLGASTVADSQDVFRAIRLANPGGLGQAEDQDVHDEPTLPLQRVMALASERDLIARQYVNGFAEVFNDGLPELITALQSGATMDDAILRCYLSLLARRPDSLIVRKRGLAVAQEVSRRAGEILASRLDPDSVAAFDTWLREDGNARNPGTTADLSAACLFVVYRDELLELPFPCHSSAPVVE